MRHICYSSLWTRQENRSAQFESGQRGSKGIHYQRVHLIGLLLISIPVPLCFSNFVHHGHLRVQMFHVATNRPSNADKTAHYRLLCIDRGYFPMGHYWRPGGSFPVRPAIPMDYVNSNK